MRSLGAASNESVSDPCPMPGHRVAVEDSVGAGDSFSAGWLTGYLAGAPLRACAAAGCAAGTAAVQAVGGVPGEEAQAVLRKEIAALLSDQH